jgi:hypothetical protein
LKCLSSEAGKDRVEKTKSGNDLLAQSLRQTGRVHQLGYSALARAQNARRYFGGVCGELTAKLQAHAKTT